MEVEALGIKQAYFSVDFKIVHFYFHFNVVHMRIALVQPCKAEVMT